MPPVKISPPNQISSDKCKKAEVATDPECWNRLRQNSAFFSRSLNKKIVINRTGIWSHFLFSAVAGVCLVFIHIISNVKALLNFGCVDGRQSSAEVGFSNSKYLENKYPKWRILEQDRSRNLKIWLRRIGVAKGATSPTFLENMVIFCFERRFSTQNSAIRLKSYISPKISGLATPLLRPPLQGSEIIALLISGR